MISFSIKPLSRVVTIRIIISPDYLSLLLITIVRTGKALSYMALTVISCEGVFPKQSAEKPYWLVF